MQREQHGRYDLYPQSMRPKALVQGRDEESCKYRVLTTHCPAPYNRKTNPSFLGKTLYTANFFRVEAVYAQKFGTALRNEETELGQAWSNLPQRKKGRRERRILLPRGSVLRFLARGSARGGSMGNPWPKNWVATETGSTLGQGPRRAPQPQSSEHWQRRIHTQKRTPG